MRAVVPFPVRTRKDESKVAFVPAVDTVKVDLNYLLFGQGLDNTLWFKFRTGEPTITDMLTLASDLNTFWVAELVPFLSVDCTFIGCEVTGQWSLSAPSVAQPITPEAGGIANPSLPGSVAFVITFLTAGRGRSSRGRNYVPAITEAAVTGNMIDSGRALSFLAAYQDILGSSFDAAWEWSVVSHVTGGLDRTTALIQPVIGARFADLVVDNQRRRLTGRGT